MDDSNIERTSQSIMDAKVLMLQMETPLDGCLKAAKSAKEKGVKVVMGRGFDLFLIFPVDRIRANFR